MQAATSRQIDNALGTIRMMFSSQGDIVCVQMVKQAKIFRENYQGVSWERLKM